MGRPIVSSKNSHKSVHVRLYIYIPKSFLQQTPTIIKFMHCSKTESLRLEKKLGILPFLSVWMKTLSCQIYIMRYGFLHVMESVVNRYHLCYKFSFVTRWEAVYGSILLHFFYHRHFVSLNFNGSVEFLIIFEPLIFTKLTDIGNPHLMSFLTLIEFLHNTRHHTLVWTSL